MQKTTVSHPVELYGTLAGVSRLWRSRPRPSAGCCDR